jgi:hypothetical protein
MLVNMVNGSPEKIGRYVGFRRELIWMEIAKHPAWKGEILYFSLFGGFQKTA